MWPTWKSLFLGNIMLIAAIQNIDLPKAGAVFNLPNLVFGDIWTRKWIAIFRKADFDGNGVISRQEFLDMAAGLADKESFDPSEKEALVKSFNDLFSALTSAAGATGGDSLNEKLLIESLKIQRDNPAFKELFRAVLRQGVTPLKLEQAGFISYNEFNRIFEDFGFFDGILTNLFFVFFDANHDGKLSVDEFYGAMIDYAFSDNTVSAALIAYLF